MRNPNVPVMIVRMIVVFVLANLLGMVALALYINFFKE
jgi:uncharacterized membrane protein YqhA